MVFYSTSVSAGHRLTQNATTIVRLLLLHYLHQHRDLVEAAHWQDWLLGIVTDTVTIVHYLLFWSP